MFSLRKMWKKAVIYWSMTVTVRSCRVQFKTALILVSLQTKVPNKQHFVNKKREENVHTSEWKLLNRLFKRHHIQWQRIQQWADPQQSESWNSFIWNWCCLTTSSFICRYIVVFSLPKPNFKQFLHWRDLRVFVCDFPICARYVYECVLWLMLFWYHQPSNRQMYSFSFHLI